MTTHLFADGPRVPTGVLSGSGLRLSRLILGTSAWQTEPDDDRLGDILDEFLTAGGTAIEVTDNDGGTIENVVGDLIEQRLARPDIVLIGRAGRGPSGSSVTGSVGDTSRRALMRALDDSLERLGTEHLDMWLVDGLDGVTPVDEVARTMEWAVTSGRATYVGISGVCAWQAVDLHHRLASSGIQLACHSAEYHLLDRLAEDDIVPAARQLGYGVIAGRGLAAGTLTGKYRHGTPADSRRAGGISEFARHYLDEANRSIVEAVVTAADGLDVHPAQVALSWTLSRSGVDAVMIGARSKLQLRALLRAATLDMPREIYQALDEISGA